MEVNFKDPRSHLESGLESDLLLHLSFITRLQQEAMGMVRIDSEGAADYASSLIALRGEAFDIPHEEASEWIELETQRVGFSAYILTGLYNPQNVIGAIMWAPIRYGELNPELRSQLPYEVHNPHQRRLLFCNNIMVALEHRRKNLGTGLWRALGEFALSGYRTRGALIISRIDRGNVASEGSVRKAGYRPIPVHNLSHIGRTYRYWLGNIKPKFPQPHEWPWDAEARM